MELVMYEYGFIDFELNESVEDIVGFEKDVKKVRYDFFCEVWWRRRVVFMYICMREVNVMWFLFFVVVVMGLVVFG